MAADRLRVEYATRVFLAEMRRQFAVARPGGESPVKDLDDYPPDQRAALMAGVAQALKAADPVADQTYEKWRSARVSEGQ